MAGEVVYADLNIPAACPTSKTLHPSQHPNVHQCPRWHRIALWLGWTGNVILAAALISLSAWGPCEGQAQGQRRTNGTERNSSLEDSQSGLKTKSDNNLTDDCGCKLCPIDWLSRKNKCYWLSENSTSWHESYEDCSEKGSQMLVIQDKEELGYIQSIPHMNQIWLGLSFTSPEKKWTWVDNSTLDETLFQITGKPERDSCAMIRRNRTLSETCKDVAKWICEKVSQK